MTFEAPDVRYPIEDDRKWATIVPLRRGFIRLWFQWSALLYLVVPPVALYQRLLCKADTTLSVVGASNQTAITRRCRDWSQVRKFVDNNLEFWRDIRFAFRPTDAGNGTTKARLWSKYLLLCRTVPKPYGGNSEYSEEKGSADIGLNRSEKNLNSPDLISIGSAQRMPDPENWLGKTALCLAVVNVLVVITLHDISKLRIPMAAVDISALPRPDPYVGLNLCTAA
ncbi:hypothetical protein B0H13DRAFT_1914194 [Mycena leptocephala]|nr:hypothetical protein B0H13DRAFT_1914194 [Mycena leptocephala]